MAIYPLMKADEYSYLAYSYKTQFTCYGCKTTYKTSEAKEEV